MGGCSERVSNWLSQQRPPVLTELHSGLEVKVVSIKDMTRVRYLREQQKPVKHLSFDPSGRLITVSCTDGVVYVYSMDTEEAELTRQVDGVVRRLETEDQASAAVVWHPDGRAFAAATATRGASCYFLTSF